MCSYDPATQTHSDCGQPYQPEAPNPGDGRLPPQSLENMPDLEEVPGDSPTKFQDRIEADVPLTEIIEQSPQTNTSVDDQDNQGTDLPTIKNEEELNNETSE